MDISGPLRAFLRTHVAPAPAAGAPLELLAQRMAFPEQAVAEMPAFLLNGAAPVLPGQFARPMYGLLALAAALRGVTRIGRPLRLEAGATLRPQLEALQTGAEKLLLARGTAPADFLWHLWLLALAHGRLNLQVPEALKTGLWRRAWGTFERQREAGPLHPPAEGGSLEASVYQDLLAIHAAYNAAVLLQEHERLNPIEKLVRWHVQNTQPDNTTTEPWGLAAFACLDDTQTFASQQLHDATQGQVQPTAVTLALLADALLTQEETAG